MCREKTVYYCLSKLNFVINFRISTEKKQTSWEVKVENPYLTSK